jgi:hypothetical protein
MTSSIPVSFARSRLGLLGLSLLAVACTGEVDMGSYTPDSSPGSSNVKDATPGTDTVPPGAGGGPDASPGMSSSDAGPFVDVTIDVGLQDAAFEDAPGIDAPGDAPSFTPPATCPNACYANASAVATTWSLPQVGGAWLQCDGLLDLAGPNSGGFPGDTIGFDFDPPNATAYMLVADGRGGAARGSGPRYVWDVAINSPVSAGSGAPVFNFSNAWTDSLLAYEISGATADAGCVTSIRMTSVTSGFSPNQSDLVFTTLSGGTGTQPVPTNGGPIPAACSNACYGSAAATAELWTLPQVGGTWVLCNGAFVVASSTTPGGFPADTVGIQFDTATATAYLLVGSDGGGVSRGPGPAYVWTVTVDQNVSSGSGAHVFTFHNALSNSQLDYTLLGADADAGCVTSLHLDSLFGPQMADLVFAGP